MEREVRYCTTSDGVRIAYSVEGEGPPLLFSHFVYAFSLSHVVPVLDQVIRGIGRGRQLIRFDIRGTGLSQQNVDDVSPAGAVRDIEAVVQSLGLKCFTLLGATLGGFRAIEYTVLHPAEVDRLVLYTSLARIEDVWPRHVLQPFAQLARANWELASRTMVDAGLNRRDAQEGLRWAELMRRSVTGETMARIIEAHTELDLTHRLAQITCPTFVCHSINDSEYPFAIGQRLAEAIPKARLVAIEGDVRGAFVEAQTTINALEKCLPAPLRVTTDSFRTAADMPAAPLTPRETEILRLIAAGQTSKEISLSLSLSIRTVGRHITNIYEKIGARSRADATAYAVWHRIATE